MNYNHKLKDVTLRLATLDSIPAGQTALHVASYWNLPDTLTGLLQAEDQANAVDSQDWTALHWACFGQSREAAWALLSHGAPVNPKDSAGWSPLFWAAHMVT
jgi:ankyrin repeat protein